MMLASPWTGTIFGMLAGLGLALLPGDAGKGH